MGTGYTRQSAAEIASGNVITDTDLEREFDQLESAFNSSTGHTHDGTTGEGPKIDLTTSVSGVLPVANGGNGAIHKLNGTTAPTVNEDSGDGYGVGSKWFDTTNDVVYFCIDATLGAAIWVRMQPYDVDLAAIAALTSAADKIPYSTGSGTWALTDFTSTARSLLDDTSVSAMRTTLGLAIGTDVQAYDAELAALAGLTSAADKGIQFTGSGTAGTYDLTSFAKTILDDANAAAVRSTLGLVIGTDVQAFDAELSAIAGLTSAADKGIYFTGSGTAATFDLTSTARTLLDDASTSAMRTTLGLVIGTDVQAFDAELSAIAGLVSAADRVPYFTGSGTASLATFTSFGRSLVDDADASAARTTLGLVIGTDVQAYDADTAKLDVEDQVVTGGARVTPKQIGGGTVTSGTVTLDPGDRALQYYTNGGAHTLAPGSNKGSIVVEITNNASAGAITLSSWTHVDGAFTTTDGDIFICTGIVHQNVSFLSIVPAQ